MEVTGLQEYLSTHQRDLVREILADQYLPQAIRGVEIPKSNDERNAPEGHRSSGPMKERTASGRASRLLGIPTVLDRWLQQAVSQQLMTRFELEFSDYSYGFRPKKMTDRSVGISIESI